ncbi:2-oxoglutarate dehydrogenase complex E1 component mitochondrial precursor [Rhizophagus clarus]|uniref:2-oxoglutarate dehydrogenase, mitochondrial n=1 Tax=Rhizophagus clarus TaxID=94130 RepID=A0A8H3L9C5_9GLOM|nr:2-oxoglutarate dehydrogenase complex E1 component mitochondrial precursor [Rhizophagus clarus]
MSLANWSRTIRHTATTVNSLRSQVSVSYNGFPQGNTTSYIEEMYEAWLRDPSSVHLSWQVYFKNMGSSMKTYQSSPTIVPLTGLTTSFSPSTSRYDDHMKVQLLVRAYQVRGYHIANLDPLGILDADLDDAIPKELDPKYYGFTEKDLDRKFTLGPVDMCKQIYCNTIGIEYTHISDRVQYDWIRSRIEIPSQYDYTIEEKRMILDRLIWSDSFERFITIKYPNERRFGLEGCEGLISGLKALIDRSVDLGMESIVLGMAHRGRLNVLSNVFRKQNESIFNEFSGLEPSDEGSGDVKYHLGMNYVRPIPSGKMIYLSLAANPAHLEVVNSVVLGKTRAIQHYLNDEKKHHHSMALLLRGDAAFAAQGVVYETIGFHDLPNYTTGGTIHIVINNQIGFTTDPRFARSTPYCSDVAKVVNAPIFHVNVEDVEAVTFVCQLASEWRQTFKKDVVVDIVCYRKHGHNEVDQPSFTQPRMYQQIAKQTPILEKYVQKLLKEGIFYKEDIEKHKEWVWNILEENYRKSKDYVPKSREWLSSTWDGFKSPKELAEVVSPVYPTGSSHELLQHVGEVISSYPKGFNVHSGLVRILKARSKAINEGQGIDWPTAEGLAFGSLLLEDKHVRLSGQDVERGTFSQRHAVLHDQVNETQYVPLNDLRPDQAKFSVCNSSLSEFGVLGFEYGYSLVNPNSLISSGEKKWLQRTGLVVLLPHGYDGQGPEHSSGRLERFLQLCDDHPYVYPPPEKMIRQHQDCNMQIIYATTPANYFHVLRRQIHRDFRKPLIAFMSKSLLRHPMARSSLAEMTGDTTFMRYIPDPHPESLASPDKITRHILCSGQIYYTLLRAREQNKMNHVAISRLEQLSPFPYDLLSQHIDKYPIAEFIWAQEEPLNSGAWIYAAPRIRTLANRSKYHEGKAAKPATRLPSASSATGNKKQHIQEEHDLLSQALIGQIIEPKTIVSGVPVWE